MTCVTSNVFEAAVTAVGNYWPAQDSVSYIPAVRNRNPSGQVVAAGRGFGMDTRHAYTNWPGTNPTVIHVTNRNATGTGSFHQAYEVETGPRIIVFDVGGVFSISQTTSAGDGTVWVAGQTAPSLVWIKIDGDYLVNITQDKSNVFFQHCAFWQAWEGSTRGQDAFEVYGSGSDKPTNVVIDHCFFGGGNDETFSIDNSGSITLIDSMVCNARGRSDFNHAYGSLASADLLSFIGNVYANCSQRMPLWFPVTGTACNHLFYNAGDNGFTLADPAQGSPGSSCYWNLEGVCSIEGPDYWPYTFQFIHTGFNNLYPDSEVYINDFRHVYQNGTELTINDEWDNVSDGNNWEATVRSNSRVATAWPTGLVAADNRSSSKEDYITLMTQNVGPRPNERFSFIQGIIDEVSSRTGGIQNDYTVPAQSNTASTFVFSGTPGEEHDDAGGVNAGRSNLEVQLLDLAEGLLS